MYRCFFISIFTLSQSFNMIYPTSLTRWLFETILECLDHPWLQKRDHSIMYIRWAWEGWDTLQSCVKLRASTPVWTLLAAWCNWDRVSLAPRSCQLPPSCQLSNAYSPSIYMCLLLCIQKKIQIRYADMKYLNTFIRTRLRNYMISCNK